MVEWTVRCNEKHNCSWDTHDSNFINIKRVAIIQLHRSSLDDECPNFIDGIVVTQMPFDGSFRFHFAVECVG